jgi:hypothetical protein
MDLLDRRFALESVTLHGNLTVTDYSNLTSSQGRNPDARSIDAW